MINDPDLRKGLLVSLITSLVVLIFIDPLLKMATNWLMSLGSSIATDWTNSIYLNAALGLREKFSFIILAFGASIMSGIVAGFVAGRVRIRQSNEPKLRQRSRIFLVSDIAFALVFLGGSFSVLISNFAELQLVASFNQRLTVLAAKANEQKIKDLQASWASMRTRKDYEAINLEMQRSSAEYSIKLPEPLWE